MRHTKALLSLLAAVLMLTGCGANFQHLPLGRSAGGPSYPVTFLFTDASLLPVGGDVRIGQAIVGKVSAVGVDRFTAVVHTQIDAGVALAVGTTARIELTTPIGDAFLNLRPPPQPGTRNLAAGATVEVTDTSRGPDVAQLLGVIGTLLNGGGIAQIKTIIEESNQVLAGREDTLRDLLIRMNDLLGTVDARQNSINQAITSLSALAATVNAEKDTIDRGLKVAAPALDVLSGERGNILGLLDKVNALSAATNSVLSRSQGKIVDIVGQLRPILDQLSATGPSLADTMGKLAHARDLVQRAAPSDYVNIDLNVDLEGSVRALLNAILPGAAPPVSPPPPVAPVAAGLDHAAGVTQLVTGGTR